MNLQWTAHLYQGKAQGPHPQHPAEKDQWTRNETYGDECEAKPELSVRTIQPHHFPQKTTGDHEDKRRRVDEPETPLSPVVQNEAPVLNPVSSDMETKNDEVAADAPLPEEPAEMSGDQPQGWIKEDAFLQSRLAHEIVRQRKEINMSQLTPERREFLKSMDTEWQTLLKNQAARVLSSSSRALAGSCDGHSDARRQHAIGAPGQGTTHHKGFYRS